MIEGKSVPRAPMSKPFHRIVFAFSVVLALAVLLGGFLPPSVRAGSFSEGNNAYTQMSVYEEVLRKIQNFYVVQPSLPAVTDGALHGLLDSLDAGSSYMSPDQYKALKAERAAKTTPAETEQFGLDVSRRYGYAVVLSVIPGSPAEKAGLAEGDVIEAIDGVGTHTMPLEMIRLKLEGRAGTSASLSMIEPSGDGLISKQLVRGPVTVPPVETRQYDSDSVLYLKPLVLSEARVTQMEQQLRGMAKAGNKKILLDLRDVSSGDEMQGVRLANAFLKSGTIASLSGQKYAQQTFAADSSKWVTDAPLAVLVNHGTAGAAEVVAAAVLAAKRGDVVGNKTFGDGAIQKTIDMPDGAALLLTVAKYNAPDGKPIEDTGVEPSVPVSLSIDQFLAEEGIASAAAQTSHPRVDDQLNKALDVLKNKQG